LLIEPRWPFGAFGVCRRKRGALEVDPCILFRTYETYNEQSTSDVLRSLGELRSTATLEILQLDRFTHDEAQYTVTHFRWLNVIKPMPADVGVVLAQIVDERLAETGLDPLHHILQRACSNLSERAGVASAAVEGRIRLFLGLSCLTSRSLVVA
jgi:hypothetical protein